MNAICFPSGDQAASPTMRDMYSFSIENGCTSRLRILLVTSFGSVMGREDALADCAYDDAASRRIKKSDRRSAICVRPAAILIEDENTGMKPQRTRRITKEILQGDLF